MKTTLHTPGSFKYFLILLTFLLSNSLLAQSGWFPQLSGTTADLNSVFFINSNTGWAVGVDKILKTTGGGLNWKPKDYPAPLNDEYTFKSVCFSNSTTGWIAGELFRSRPGIYYRIILKTNNAGENWELSYINSDYGLNSVCYRTLDAGWSVGFNAILKSTNQGIDWESQNFPHPENDDFTFNSVCFINSQTGWIAGDVYTNPPGFHSKVIFKTVNGGLNWEEIYRGSETGLNSVNFCSSINGWSVGNREILTSYNGGSNWVSQAVFGGHNSNYYLKSVFFSNTLTGWVAGGKLETFGPEYSSVLLKTTNGGINWFEKLISANENNYQLNSVFFVNETTGWTVGNGGTIFKTIDGGSTDIKSKNEVTPDSYSLEQNYPNPFNSVTSIKLQVTSYKFVKLIVFDMLGREVATLINEKLQPGTYEVTFDAGDLPSGVYFYKLTVADPMVTGQVFTDTKRMVLIK